jgi:hypothetical protein
MKMKPILFSTPMVQAILDGRKTQTRRVIKIDDAPENWKISIAGTSIVRTEPYDVKLPRYAAGDILWVRETWSKDENGEYVYRTNYGTTEDDSFPPSMFKWKPSIHMPREAARIFLRVTNVSVERLQEITVDDCRLEGCCSSDCLQTGPHSPDCKCDTLFYNVWNDISAKRGYGWDKNPWVWVVKFERISKDEAYKKEGLK